MISAVLVSIVGFEPVAPRPEYLYRFTSGAFRRFISLFIGNAIIRFAFLLGSLWLQSKGVTVCLRNQLGQLVGRGRKVAAGMPGQNQIQRMRRLKGAALREALAGNEVQRQDRIGAPSFHKPL